jgi:hypothetical protein
MLQEMGGIEAYGSFRRFRFAGVFEPQALPSYRPKKRLQAATGYKPSRCPLARYSASIARLGRTHSHSHSQSCSHARLGRTDRRSPARSTPQLLPCPPGADDRADDLQGEQERCSHARLGRTLDPSWDLGHLDPRKCLGVPPMGADATEAASC